MTPQLTHTLATFIAMTACALVVGSSVYFLCLLLKKLDLMSVADILTIFAWFVMFSISSVWISILPSLFGGAGLCAFFKTPGNKIWKSNFRFLLTCGSISLITGSVLMHLIWNLTSSKFQMVLFANRDTEFLLLALAPCAISAMHSVFANSHLKPGTDRHLRAEEVE